MAVAVDQAQYAQHAGPCIDAIETAVPLAVPQIATTMRWPATPPINSDCAQAIGISIADQTSTPDRAYTTLRLLAADEAAPLLETAKAIIAGKLA